MLGHVVGRDQLNDRNDVVCTGREAEPGSRGGRPGKWVGRGAPQRHTTAPMRPCTLPGMPAPLPPTRQVCWVAALNGVWPCLQRRRRRPLLLRVHQQQLEQGGGHRHACQHGLHDAHERGVPAQPLHLPQCQHSGGKDEGDPGQADGCAVEKPRLCWGRWRAAGVGGWAGEGEESSGAAAAARTDCSTQARPQPAVSMSEKRIPKQAAQLRAFPHLQEPRATDVHDGGQANGNCTREEQHRAAAQPAPKCRLPHILQGTGAGRGGQRGFGAKRAHLAPQAAPPSASWGAPQDSHTGPPTPAARSPASDILPCLSLCRYRRYRMAAE